MNRIRRGALLLSVATMLAFPASAQAQEPSTQEQASELPPTQGQSPRNPGPADRLAQMLGDEDVWTFSSETIAELHECGRLLLACVQAVMEAHEASSNAIDFFHLTGWFLTEVQPGSPVWIGTIVNPWRANENEQLALLGGLPAVIYPEEEGARLSIQRSVDFASLAREHPAAMLWAAGPTLEGAETTDEGQRFVLSYRILDGCHACSVLGQVRTAFDFASDGTYRGMQLLGVVRASR